MIRTHEDILNEFKGLLPSELFELVTDDLLGNGVFRVVYGCTLCPDLVLKFEMGSHYFQNVMEWKIWQQVAYDKELSKWLAPCKFISPCGTVLAMKRTNRPAPKQYPDKLPRFLTDIHQRNFGMFEERFVSHDYGSIIMLTRSSCLSMRKMEWKL